MTLLFVLLFWLTPAAPSKKDVDFQRIIPDTLYQPFKEGKQLIIIDYEAAWHRYYRQKDLDEPRALHWIMDAPPHKANIYMLRDTLGEILHTYNVQGRGIKERKLRPVRAFISKEAAMRQQLGLDIQITSHLVPMPDFPETLFRIYDQEAELGARSFPRKIFPDYSDLAGYPVGLLNRNGEVILPPIFEFVHPQAWKNQSGISHFIVKKSGYFGLIDRAGNTIVPFRYDHLYPDEQHPEVLVAVADLQETYFDFDGKKVPALEYISTPKSNPLEH
ncbi:MAG: WG repeat-containing protein [Bacteroidota bacterium]